MDLFQAPSGATVRIPATALQYLADDRRARAAAAARPKLTNDEARALGLT